MRGLAPGSVPACSYWWEKLDYDFGSKLWLVLPVKQEGLSIPMRDRYAEFLFNSEQHYVDDRDKGEKYPHICMYYYFSRMASERRFPQPHLVNELLRQSLATPEMERGWRERGGPDQVNAEFLALVAGKLFAEFEERGTPI